MLLEALSRAGPGPAIVRGETLPATRRPWTKRPWDFHSSRVEEFAPEKLPKPPKKGSLVVFQASIFEGRSVKLLGWHRWLDFVRWFSLVISQDFGVKSGFCAVFGWLHLTANLGCLGSKDSWQDVQILKDFHPLKPKSLHVFEDLRFYFPDGQPQTYPIIQQLPWKPWSDFHLKCKIWWGSWSQQEWPLMRAILKTSWRLGKISREHLGVWLFATYFGKNIAWSR